MNRPRWRAIAIFLALAFAWSWTGFLVPLAFGEPGSAPRQIAMAVGWTSAMWGPGLAAIVVTLAVLREPFGSLGLGRFGPWRYYLVAWLIPPLLAVAAGIVSWAAGLGTFDPTLSALRPALARQGIEDPALVWALVGLQVAIALTAAPVFNVLFAIGEEIGWRGFLLPRLEPLGRWRAVVLSGAIWGFWHAPAIAQGHNYPGQPVLGIALMVGFCVLIGTFFSWLYFSTGSTWAPALAHGSLNATAGLPLLFLTGVNLVLGGTPTSLAGWAPLAGIAIWIALTGRMKTNPPTGQSADTTAQ
ncbi:MAG: CPBP family intramembrane glutamic endopeptidase [Dehalococcoidia bacterium]